MTPMRLVHSMVAVLAILGTACSSSSSPSSGSGGSHGTGGVPSQGGTTASGGQSGTGGAAGTGGAPSQGGTLGSGGTTQPGTGGVNGTGGRTGLGSGGAGTGGRLGSGGAGAGGASTGAGGTLPAASGGGGASGGASSSGLGGTSSSGSGGATGSGSGGRSGSGGATGPGSGGSSGGSGADGGVAQSAGCGKTPTLKNGSITIQSTRKYILHVPDGYDNSHPYRLVFAFAESGSSAQSVADRKYFTMQTQDTKNTTIFAAPDAVGSAGSWSKSDVAFTDAILAQLEGDLCVDTTRIFATGFSFGGAMSLAIACTRADVFRAVAFFSGADLTGSCATPLTKPIAYYASQASEDAGSMSRTSPPAGEYWQAQFAAINGCTAVPSSITFPASGQKHTCTIYQGCSAGHPTEFCVFNGGHGWEPKDPGDTTSWDAPEAWKFITQF